MPDGEVGTIPGIVDGLLSSPERLEAMRVAMRTLARPHAAEEIADAVIELARAGR